MSVQQYYILLRMASFKNQGPRNTALLNQHAVVDGKCRQPGVLNQNKRSDLFIDDRLNTIAIWINHERGEVMRAILGVQSCPAIVLPAMLKRRSMECGHSLSRRSCKGCMKTFTAPRWLV